MLLLYLILSDEIIIFLWISGHNKDILQTEILAVQHSHNPFLGEMAELQRELGQLSVADDYSVDPMVWNCLLYTSDAADE